MAMEPQNKLIRQSNELQRTELSSLTLVEKLLLSELDLTATNAKIALEPRIGKEFLRVLSEFPAEAVEAAFRAWRDESPFFPAISDIRHLAATWVRRQAEQREMAEQAVRRREIEAARECGELISWPEVVKKFNEIVARDPQISPLPPDIHKAMPEIVITPDRRERIREQSEAMKARYSTQK